MEITGKIIQALELREGVGREDRAWASQDFVLETVERFPQRVVFNVFGKDKLEEYNIQVGQVLKISLDFRAREYNGRWFNEIRAWKVERDNTEANMAVTTVHGVASEDDPFAPEHANEPI